MSPEVEAFREKGAVCLRGVVDPSWLDVLARGLERNLADPSPYGCRYTEESSPGGFVDDYCNWQRFAYRDQIRSDDEDKTTPSRRAANKRWAELIYRIYEVDPLTCAVAR